MINFKQGGQMQNAMTPMRWLQLPAEYKKQLENWVHWTRRDLGQPSSYKSIMGYLFKSGRDGGGDSDMPVDPIIYVFDQDAERFDSLLNGLSREYLHIFKIQYIDRVRTRTNKFGDGVFGYVPRHMMSKKYKVLEMFNVMTISRSTYERRLQDIDSSLKRRGGLA